MIKYSRGTCIPWNVTYVLAVPVMSGDNLAHETISSCHIGVKWFLKSVFQILSDKIYFGGKNQQNLVIGSPLHPPKHYHLLHTDSSMKGLRSHTDNLKVLVLWTSSQAQNHSKTTSASDSPSSGPLEFGSNGSETVSFRLNQTTPQQWFTNRMVALCTEIFLH